MPKSAPYFATAVGEAVAVEEAPVERQVDGRVPDTCITPVDDPGRLAGVIQENVPDVEIGFSVIKGKAKQMAADFASGIRARLEAAVPHRIDQRSQLRGQPGVPRNPPVEHVRQPFSHRPIRVPESKAAGIARDEVTGFGFGLAGACSSAEQADLRAALAPWVSMTHAACSVIRRAAESCAAESAIQFCTVCFSPSTEPCASRYVARSQSMSNARRDTPSQRMQ